MQRKWKRSWLQAAKVILPPVAAGMLLGSACTPVWANPTGGIVTSGAAAIAANGNTLTITQTTDKAAINWQSFNIGAGEKVQFLQPGASSVALNRVVGNNASAIYGTLTANGRVYLINPNGVLFAPGSQVNVGGLVASTLNISDSDFLAGKYTFTNGGSAGSVTNQGTITAADHAVFIGPQVKNEGAIVARVTGLTAGNQVSLDFAGDNLLNVTVDTAAANSGVTNSGSITAPGGLVVMTTGTQDALLSTVVNNSGIIRAQNVGNAGGVIKLIGSTVNVDGTLDASAPSSGDGGFIDTSGAQVNIASGATITAAAPSGKAGLWMLDPADIIIDATLANTLENALHVGNDVAVQADRSITVAHPVTWANDRRLSLYATSGKHISININAPIKASLGSLTLNAGSGGSITASAAISVGGMFNLTGGTWNQVATTLPSFYAKNFQIGSPFIRAIGGNGSESSPYLIADVYGLQGIRTNVFEINYKLANNIDASGTANWWGSNGWGFKPIGNNQARFGGIFDGSGYTISNLTIYHPYTAYVGLFGYSVGIISNVGLVNVNITDLAESSSVGGLVGWNDGTITNCYSKGTVTSDYDGVNRIGGLVGYNQGTIEKSYSAGTVIGNQNSLLGGLVGSNICYIENSYSTADVSHNARAMGSYTKGGLVGLNGGYIEYCYSTGTVTGNNNSSDNIVGGLVGRNVHTIKSSYSTGAVTGGYVVGGLVGYNDGDITNSYSTGAVTGGNVVGGLVGDNLYGSIKNSYWDVDTTGQQMGSGKKASGATGLYSSADSLAADASRKSAFAASSYNGWDIATDITKVWYIDDGYSYPLLSAFLKPMQVPIPEDGTTNPTVPTYPTDPAYIGAVGSAVQLVSGGFAGQRGGATGLLYTIIDTGVNLDGQSPEQKQ